MKVRVDVGVLLDVGVLENVAVADGDGEARQASGFKI